MQSQASPTDSLAGNRPGKLAGRPAALAVAAVCWAPIILAGTLAPAAVGHGTHRQLGMPSCSWLTRTGYPCPTCGLTTSQAAMARGQVALAFAAHPFGVALFAAAGGVGIAALAQLLTGKAFLSALRLGRWWLLGGLLGLIAGWGIKILTGLASGQLPLR